MSEHDQRVIFRVPERLLARVDAVARERGETRSVAIREALRVYVESMERKRKGGPTR